MKECNEDIDERERRASLSPMEREREVEEEVIRLKGVEGTRKRKETHVELEI